MRSWKRACRFLLDALLAATATGCDEEDPERGSSDAADTSEQVERVGRDSAGGGPADAGTDSIEIPYRTGEGEPARFAFRSGIVDMEYIGIMNGVRRLRFDRYGLREMTFDSTYAIDRNVPLMPNYSMLIMTPESYSIIDLRKREGHFGPNGTFDRYLREWRQGSRPLGELVLDASGGRRLADTLLLGKYPCRVYRQDGNGLTRTIYTHGGVPIGEAVTFGGNENTGYRVLPRSVTFNVDIPDPTFTIPSGYRMTPFEN